MIYRPKLCIGSNTLKFYLQHNLALVSLVGCKFFYTCLPRTWVFSIIGLHHLIGDHQSLHQIEAWWKMQGLLLVSLAKTLYFPFPLTFYWLELCHTTKFISKKGCAAAAAKSLQSCPTLCDPIDGSPPGSPVPGILQARTLEWVAISFSNAWKWKVNVKSLSHVRLLATPWTAAHQAPLSMGFSRQEYWSGVPLPSLARKAVNVFNWIFKKKRWWLCTKQVSVFPLATISAVNFSSLNLCTYWHYYLWEIPVLQLLQRQNKLVLTAT